MKYLKLVLLIPVFMLEYFIVNNKRKNSNNTRDYYKESPMYK